MVDFPFYCMIVCFRFYGFLDDFVFFVGFMFCVVFLIFLCCFMIYDVVIYDFFLTTRFFFGAGAGSSSASASTGSGSDVSS